jgi:hypothetical protein
MTAFDGIVGWSTMVMATMEVRIRRWRGEGVEEDEEDEEVEEVEEDKMTESGVV